MVNLGDASSIPEPDESPNLAVAGKTRSFANRPRARSESILRRHQAMSMTFSRSHTPPASFREEDLARPRLLRQLSPHSDSRRKMFQLHSRSHSSPPSMFEDDFTRPSISPRSDTLPFSAVKEDITEDEMRNQSKSFATDDDETIRDFDLDSPVSMDNGRRGSVENTTSRQRYIFGRAIPLWMTTRPNSGRITTWIAKNAPCFWCSRETLSVTTTNQAILKRLGALCGLLGLCQAGSASYLLIVMFSNSLVDRNAQYVDRGESPSLEAVPSLWNVNTYILFAGFLGTIMFFIMIIARRVFRELDLTGALRFMWCMLWIIPLEIFCAIGMFDYHGVAEVWGRHWWSARTMAWFRSKTCRGNSYNTYCVVPIDGLPEFNSEEEWCLSYYDATSCEDIRNNAQFKLATYSKTFFVTNGAIAICTVIMVRSCPHVSMFCKQERACSNPSLSSP